MPHVTAVYGKSAEIDVSDAFFARRQLEQADAFSTLADEVRVVGLTIDMNPMVEANKLVVFIGKTDGDGVQVPWEGFKIEDHCPEGPAPAEVEPFFSRLLVIFPTLGWSTWDTAEGVVALNIH
jgi:hypothetical protein